MAKAPGSAAALTLYALACALEIDQAGYLYKLVKLRDLSAVLRQLAYRPIEMMAVCRTQGEERDSVKARLDKLALSA